MLSGLFQAKKWPKSYITNIVKISRYFLNIALMQYFQMMQYIAFAIFHDKYCSPLIKTVQQVCGGEGSTGGVLDEDLVRQEGGELRVRRLERPSHCSSAVPTLKRSHAKHLARLSVYAVQASLCRHVDHLASLLLCIDGNSLKQKLCTLATLHWAAVQIEHTSLPDCGGCRGRWQGQAARTLGDQRQDLQTAPEHPLDGAGRASEQRTRNCPG